MVIPTSPEAASARNSEEMKRRALRFLSDLPPFPAILNRLIASLAGEDVSFHKVGELIEKDTVVTGNLLHLVNSALYATRGTVTSVRHALALLGIEKARNAILSMSMTRMWGKIPMPGPWSMARFNLHSASVAVLSDLLAQRLPVVYPEGAFVAGLLHDIGRLIIAHALPEEFLLIEELHSVGRSRLECEWEVLGFTHATLSAEALTRWRLPEPVLTAVLDHHSPQPADHQIRQMALSRVVSAADNYVNSTSVSIEPKPDSDCANPELIEALGLEGGLERVLADFEAELAAMSVFFK